MQLGRYSVEGELGRGGLGVVFRVRDPGGRELALKLIQRRGRAGAAERFAREARLHELLGEEAGFVPLLDAGELPEGSFLVMPLMSGGTLRERLEQGPLPTEVALALGITLADALGRAHAAGVVHRDVKPDNVLFSGGGRPLVSDLGLAKHFRGDVDGASQSVALSRSGEMRGTVGYMAPEQLRDARSVGPASDVFALAAVLYECLAGEPPFRGETLVQLLDQISSGDYEPLGSRAPHAPAWLVALVERCLATDPARRCADGAALAAALRAGGPAHRARGPLLLGAGLIVGIGLALGGALWARGARGGSPSPAASGAPSASLAAASPSASPPPPDPWAGLPRGGERLRLVQVARPAPAESPVPESPVLAAGALSDGRLLTIQRERLRAWDAVGPLLLADAPSPFHAASVRGRFAVTLGQKLQVWSLADASRVASIAFEADLPSRAVLLPDGEQVLFAHQGRVYLARSQLGKGPEPRAIGQHQGRVDALAAGESGLASASGSEVVLYASKGSVLGRVAQPNPVAGLALRPDELVTLDLGGTLRGWSGQGDQASWSLALGERVTRLALSPQGDLAAVTGEEPRVLLVDLVARQVVERVELGPSRLEPSCVGWSPSGRELLIGTSAGLALSYRLQDPAPESAAPPTLTPLASGGDPRTRQAGPLAGLCALSSGELLSAEQGYVYQWDPRDGSLLRRFAVGSPLHGIAPLGTHQVLTLGGGRSLRGWDLGPATPREVLRIGLSDGPVDLSVGPRGRFVALALESTGVELWDLPARRRVWGKRILAAKRVLVLDAAGRVVVGDAAGNLRRLSPSGELEHSRRAAGAVVGLARAATPGNYVVANQTVAMEIAPEQRGPLWMSGGGGSIESLAVRGPDVLVGVNLGGVWRIDAGDHGQVRWRLESDALVGSSPRVAITPTGEGWLGGSDRRVALIDLEQGAERWQWTGHRHAATNLAWDAQGEQLVSAGPRALQLWTLSGAGASARLTPGPRRESIGFLSVFTASPQAVFARELEQPLRHRAKALEVRSVLLGLAPPRSVELKAKLERVAISPEGRHVALMSEGGGKRVQLYQLHPELRPLASIELSHKPLSLALDHEGRMLAACSFGQIEVRDARQGRVLWQGQRMAHSPTFARDREGRPRLVFPLAQSVWRLDLVAGHFERLLTTPAKIQRAREAGPGRLALMTSEGQVSLWDSASARELGRFDLGDPCDRAASLAATTSGTHLAVGTQRGRVLVYALPPP